MALQLSLSATPDTFTTFDFPTVRAELRNDGPDTPLVPSPNEDGGALELHFFTPDGRVFRRVSDLTRQHLQSGLLRVNSTRAYVPLAPGRTLRWEFDLAQYHLPLPAGSYTVVAALFLEPGGQPLLSAPIALTVAPLPMRALSAERDNPVMERADLLIAAGEGADLRLWLRQVSPTSPMAAEYNQPMPAIRGMANLFCAAANFYQTASFRPLLERWILWEKGQQIQAALLREGRPTGQGRRAPLPADGSTLLPQAFYSVDHRLYVFFDRQGRYLDCYELLDAELRLQFSIPMPSPEAARRLDITAEPERIHLLIPFEGLAHLTVDYQGQRLARRRLHRTRLRLHSVTYQPEFDRVVALFWTGTEGRLVELVALDGRRPGEGIVIERRILPTRGSIVELACDYDRNGRFHLLYSTTRQRLYYITGARAPFLVAQGETRFFPRILAPSRVFLGNYEQGAGYRFRQFTRKPHDPRLLTYDR